VQRLEGTTVFLLSGRALPLIGMVTELARELQPSAVVLEDVDLVAEDRGLRRRGEPRAVRAARRHGRRGRPTPTCCSCSRPNRADLLEPALAARPGRVDVAVEIGLPDAERRRRLFEVYSRGVPLAVEPADVDAVVERTEGVTASFLKELVRRAVLESLTDRPERSSRSPARTCRGPSTTCSTARSRHAGAARRAGRPVGSADGRAVDRGYGGHGGVGLDGGGAGPRLVGRAVSARLQGPEGRRVAPGAAREDGSHPPHPPAVETP
jgi:hypothetical protein